MKNYRLLMQFRCQIYLVFFLKWLFISIFIGGLVGVVCAGFLISLESITNWRDQHFVILYFLPFGGLTVAALYYYLGEGVVRGNNQLFEEIEQPKNKIPLRMAPLVLAGTLITHLFGGSAGREGTAVQIGGAIADQFTRLFRLNLRDRRQLLICGVSAGFAAVFGTPLAGAVFAVEVSAIGSLKYGSLLPALFSAVIANYVCTLFPVHHTAYFINDVPSFNILNLGYSVFAGLIFGLAARSFSFLLELLISIQKRLLKNPFIRAFLGGAIVLALVLWIGNTKYTGLGVSGILESFVARQMWYVFLLKMLLTILTLSCGFKGGEVTPLFFIGAALGSALSLLIPLPVSLLAGMGFIAVFCGAANTPLACILMGVELFGAGSSIYIATACCVAYTFSGHAGIYSSQRIAVPKHPFFRRLISK